MQLFWLHAQASLQAALALELDGGSQGFARSPPARQIAERLHVSAKLLPSNQGLMSNQLQVSTQAKLMFQSIDGELVRAGLADR